MADVHSKETRSYNMARIKGKDTTPELLVRKFLHSKGLRYRLNSKNLPGKPDLYLAKYKTVVEVRGCFWHGHENCKYFKLPKTRTEWWENKISDTKERDLANLQKLEELGIRTLVVWECDLKGEKKNNTLNHLMKEILV